MQRLKSDGALPQTRNWNTIAFTLSTVSRPICSGLGSGGLDSRHAIHLTSSSIWPRLRLSNVLHNHHNNFGASCPPGISCGHFSILPTKWWWNWWLNLTQKIDGNTKRTFLLINKTGRNKNICIASPLHRFIFTSIHLHCIRVRRIHYIGIVHRIKSQFTYRAM